MGRFISWLILIPVAAAAIAFAVSNRTLAPLDLWPFPFATQLPVFTLVLGALVVGFNLGGMMSWLSGGRTRRRARHAEARADRAERDYQQAKLRLARLEDEARQAREKLAVAEAGTEAGAGGSGDARLPAPKDAA